MPILFGGVGFFLALALLLAGTVAAWWKLTIDGDITPRQEDPLASRAGCNFFWDQMAFQGLLKDL